MKRGAGRGEPGRAGGGSRDPAPQLPAALVPLALALLSALRLGLWALWFRPSGPLGTDPAIWGLTALDLAAGNPPLAVPLYPWLAGLAGDPVSGGLAVSLLASWALPPAAWWAAGRGRAGLAAGGAALLLADPLIYAFQLQPDALFALWAVLLAGALLREHWVLAIPLAAGGLVLREHGGPILMLVLLAALSAGAWRARLGRAAALLGLALAAPVPLGGTPGGPQPWSARTGESLALLTTARKPPHLTRGEWADYRVRSPLGRAAWHARRALALAWDGLIWIGLAAGLALSALLLSRDRRLLLALLPAIPSLASLILWSERRHIAAVTPVAVAVIAAWRFAGAAPGAPRPRGAPLGRHAALLVPTALLLCGAARLPEEGRRQRRESGAFSKVRAVAERVCELAEPGDLILSLDQRLLLWCPLPQLADPASPMAWRAWLVAPPGSVRPPWTPVDRSPGEVWIWRLSPELRPRPCQDIPTRGRYLLASGPTPHPAFPDVPLPGRPPVPLPAPDPEACP